MDRKPTPGEAREGSGEAQLQNQQSVTHRSFAQKILQFFNPLVLERNC